jgi:hypothetical protein
VSDCPRRLRDAQEQFGRQASHYATAGVLRHGSTLETLLGRAISFAWPSATVLARKPG